MTELDVFRQSLEVSRMALVVSVLISTISIVFGILSMAFQRSHNRKSVKPFCNIEVRRTQSGMGMGIANAGLGPMLITRIGLVKGDGMGKDAPCDLADLVPQGPHCRHFTEECTDRVLPPMATQRILEWDHAGSAGGTNAGGVMKKLRGYSLVVSFSDVYDHTYEKIAPLGAIMSHREG
jgi:hypothetical protein